MIGPEALMPNEESFDHEVGIYFKEIEQSLEAIMQANPFGEPLGVGAYDERKSHLANSLAVLAGAQTQSEAGVMAKGALFAREVVMVMYGDSAELVSISSMVEARSTPEEIQEFLKHECQRYIADRPNIQMLIAKYSKTIDPESVYPEELKRVCSLVFLLAERAYAERYQSAWVASVDPENF